MSTYANDNYSNTCSVLDRVIQDYTTRIKLSEQNKNLKATYEGKCKQLQGGVQYCNAILDFVKPMIEDLHEYIDGKRKASMENINAALRMAGEIIKDATEGIYFQLDGDEAYLVTPDGLEVDAVEGCGYRQISSTFLRSVILEANPGKLSTLMLDEVFSLVSPDNSASLSLYLNVMTQNTQVISIEQKPQVYSNIDHVRYVFTKGEQFAEVTKEMVTHGGDTINESSEREGDF